MLHGSLKSEWFNPLYNRTAEAFSLIKKGYLHPGDITWMTPCFYQTHKLTNEGSTGASISIQGYQHTWQSDKSFETFSESFNFYNLLANRIKVAGKSDWKYVIAYR